MRGCDFVIRFLGSGITPSLKEGLRLQTASQKASPAVQTLVDVKERHRFCVPCSCLYSRVAQAGAKGGSGLRDQDSGFRVLEGFEGFEVASFEFRIWVAELRVRGLGCRVQGCKFRVRG